MTVIDGNALEDIAATALWTQHNHAAEAKRRNHWTRSARTAAPGRA